MDFDELIQLHALKLKAAVTGSHGRFIDAVLEHSEVQGLRQMCAKVPDSLYQRLEEVTDLLNMSKREFIEAAVASALDRADDIIQRMRLTEVAGNR